jgi:hypothetical protein
VTVSALGAEAPDGPSPETVLEHLQHAGGHLRSEVAAAVTRRRTPLLVYRLQDPTIGSNG